MCTQIQLATRTKEQNENIASIFTTLNKTHDVEYRAFEDAMLDAIKSCNINVAHMSPEFYTAMELVYILKQNKNIPNDSIINYLLKLTSCDTNEWNTTVDFETELMWVLMNNHNATFDQYCSTISYNFAIDIHLYTLYKNSHFTPKQLLYGAASNSLKRRPPIILLKTKEALFYCENTKRFKQYCSPEIFFNIHTKEPLFPQYIEGVKDLSKTRPKSIKEITKQTGMTLTTKAIKTIFNKADLTQDQISCLQQQLVIKRAYSKNEREQLNNTLKEINISLYMLLAIEGNMTIANYRYANPAYTRYENNFMPILKCITQGSKTEPFIIVVQDLSYKQFRIYTFKYFLFGLIFRNIIHNKRGGLTNIAKKIEINKNLKAPTFTNIERCQGCINTHSICPCNNLNNVPLIQHPIHSTMNTKWEYDPIYYNLKVLGWEYSESLISILRMAANVSLCFWDVEAITYCNQKTPPTCTKLLSDADNTLIQACSDNSYQSIYLISYGDLITPESATLAERYNASNNLNEKSEIRNRLLTIFNPQKVIPNESLSHRLFELGNNKTSTDLNCTESNFKTQKQLVARFFKHVFNRASLVYKIKQILLLPLYKTITKIIKLHLSLTGNIEVFNEIVADDFIIDLFDFNFINKLRLRGIHKSLIKSLERLMKEFTLFAFNGSHYDNPIILPPLLSLVSNNMSKTNKTKHLGIPTRLRQIQISRKNNDINSIILKLSKTTHISLKDYKHLESSDISLSKLIKIYCPKRDSKQKGLFPHAAATSIKTLKQTKTIPSPNDSKWISVLTGTRPPKTEILQAKKDFKTSQSENLYDYACFYGANDTISLRQAVYYSRLHDWNDKQCDFVLMNKYTLASLSSFLATKINPLTRKTHIPPFQYSNPIINNVVDSAIIGGLTICAASGNFEKNITYINSHLTVNDVPINVSASVWPALRKARDKITNEAPSVSTPTDGKSPLIANPQLASGVKALDVRNLYGSAMCEAIPCGPYHIWHPMTRNCNDNSNYKTFYKQKSNQQYLWTEEFYVTRWYLETKIPKNEKVIVVRSGSHASNQMMYHSKASADLYIVTKYKLPVSKHYKNIIIIRFINYDGIYFHGRRHKSICPLYDSDNCHKEDCDDNTDTNRMSLQRHNELEYYVQQIFSIIPCADIGDNEEYHIRVDYEVINSCDLQLCTQRNRFINRLVEINPKYSVPYLYRQQTATMHELKTNILMKRMTGFVVIKDLVIDKTTRHPSFGFCIQKNFIPLDNLSKETKDSITPERLDYIKNSATVLSVNEYYGYHCISTQYLCFLNDNFKINVESFSIVHFIQVEFDNFLAPYIRPLLLKRDNLKKLLAANVNCDTLRLSIDIFKIKNEINACYGSFLLNLAKYTSIQLKQFDVINKKPGQLKIRDYKNSFTGTLDKKGIRVVKTFLAGSLTHKLRSPKRSYIFGCIISSPVPRFNNRSVGCSILWNSKTIYLGQVYFLLKYLDPACSEYLYSDTDSCHWLCKSPVLSENVDEEYRKTFLENAYKYLSGFPNSAVYGTLESEGYFNAIVYKCEKVYKKVTQTETVECYIRGVSKAIVDQSIYNSDRISANIVRLGATVGGGMNITSTIKTFRFVSCKRYFRGHHSVVYLNPIIPPDECTHNRRTAGAANDDDATASSSSSSSSSNTQVLCKAMSRTFISLQERKTK